MEAEGSRAQARAGAPEESASVERFNSPWGWSGVRFVGLWLFAGLAYGSFTASIDANPGLGNPGGRAAAAIGGGWFWAGFMMLFMSALQTETVLGARSLGSRSWWGVFVRRKPTMDPLDPTRHWVARSRNGHCKLMPLGFSLDQQPAALLEALRRQGFRTNDDLSDFRTNYPRTSLGQLLLRCGAIAVWAIAIVCWVLVGLEVGPLGLVGGGLLLCSWLALYWQPRTPPAKSTPTD